MSNVTADIVVREDTTFDTHLTPGIGGPIAALVWGGDLKVLVSSTHPHQADLLREWAHRLNALAADVDRFRGHRQPEGYAAPVVTHVGGCNELCDGDSHCLVAEQPIPYALDERKAAEMHQ